MSSDQSMEAQARELLREVYLPEGVDRWLTNPNRNFGGERAVDLIERGEGERVIGAIHALLDGAYL